MNTEIWKAPMGIAHRGSRLLWPENTITAFRAATDLGYRHLETDLHATANGVLVCHHDATVDRTTNGTGPISRLSFAELEDLDAGFRHRVGGEYPFRGSGSTVPSLKEVATELSGTAFVVDLKADDLEQPLYELIADHGWQDRFIVGSFSDDRLARFREISKNTVATSAGPAEARSWLLASKVGRGATTVPRALQLPATMRGISIIDRRLIEAAHERGLQVHVWTINDPSEMNRILDLGADAVITDRPDLLKELLMARGEWTEA